MQEEKSFEFETAAGPIRIGKPGPAFLIAELGSNHNGSLSLAKDLVRAAALNGAHAVKIQKRDLETLASAQFLQSDPGKIGFLGKSQMVARTRLELSFEQVGELMSFSQDLGVTLFSSVFDPQSFYGLRDVGMKLFKVASHSMTNLPLLEALRESDVSVVASTGGCTREEIQNAHKILSARPLMLMHCVSAYPTPDQEINLDTIQELQKEFGVPIGFSSHEIGITASLAAIAKGAVAVERHFTLSKSMAGFDHALSLDPREFGELALHSNRIHAMAGRKVEVLDSEKSVRQFHVGLYASRNLSAGEVLQEQDLNWKFPLGDEEKYFRGLEIERLLGKRVRTEISQGTPIPRDAVSD